MAERYTLAAKIRVRYSETDQMKIVYNANYLDWFEVTRTELCRGWGRPYTEWEENGLMLPVVEAYCRYKHPACYDDEIELWGRVSDLKVHSIHLNTGSYAPPTANCSQRGGQGMAAPTAAASCSRKSIPSICGSFL